MSLAAVRDLRELRVPATQDEITDLETDVLSGFVLARASVGLVDATIYNDVNHLELIRDWFGRPLWEMQPCDADTYVGKVLPDAIPVDTYRPCGRTEGVFGVPGAAAPGRVAQPHRPHRGMPAR